MASRAQSLPKGLRVALTGFIVVWLMMAAFPFVWTLWGSFKVELDFFSIADWTNAITGRRTEDTHGSPFTGAGYHGAWVEEGFLHMHAEKTRLEEAHAETEADNSLATKAKRGNGAAPGPRCRAR